MLISDARKTIEELLEENKPNSGSTMEGMLGRKYVIALRRLLNDSRVMMPREDVAELKEKLQEGLNLILPTRSNTTGGIEYLTPTPGQVQNGAFQVQRVLQSFPFYAVGTKRQEQLKTRKR
jgi:hypothetical protein